MARPKEFDQDRVLDQAVEIFWAKGYEATSMQDLVDGMGIRRGSLYGTFGSKQQLFLMSLRRYGEVVVKKLLEILESRPSGVESIELFFGQLVEHLLAAGPLRSCLVTNSAIERGLTDDATQQQVCRMLKAIEKGFYQTLLRARQNDEIPAGIDLKSTAEFLTSSMQGLLVVGKVRSEREVLEAIKEVTLSVLKTHQPTEKGSYDNIRSKT
jgi:TetR/AcrR family transcriptional regulator, transcriptional repressor for nem operon